jgi:hypothetical protein
VIWKTINDKIFNNLVGNVDAVVDCIQCLFWQWFLNKVAANSCLLYEWVTNPGHCMIRWGMVFVAVWIYVAVVWHVCLVPRVTVVCWGWVVSIVLVGC